MNDAPKGPDKSEDKILDILEKAKENQTKVSNIQESQINKVQEIETIEQIVEEAEMVEIEETPVVSLNTVYDSLLEMYG